jgi:hypothetical protein
LGGQRKKQRKATLPQSVANANIVVFGVGDPSFGRIRVRRDASAQATVLQVSKVMMNTVFVRVVRSLHVSTIVYFEAAERWNSLLALYCVLLFL